jgi:hypothetical protein
VRSDSDLHEPRTNAEQSETGDDLRVSYESETWRPAAVCGDRYEVSSLGRLRSLYFKPPRLVTPFKDKDGYPVVALWRGRKRRTMNLHRLVGLTFHGTDQNALHNEVAHLDGDRANVRADNLKWVSKVENHFHMRAHGTHPAGENHPSAKLTAKQVAEILRRQGTGAELAARYGVSRGTVYDIWCGRRWRRSGEADAPVSSSCAGEMVG